MKFCLLLLFLKVVEGQICPTALTTATQSSITLYSYGTPATPSYAHIISTDPNVVKTAATYNITAKAEYALSATTIAGAANDCPSICLVALQPVYYSNNTINTASMARPQDLYTSLQKAPFPVMYCAASQNNCGATVPLYLYYSESALDYYVSTNGGGPALNTTAYPPATVAPSLMPGSPLCYGWPVMTTTTMSTTVNYNNTNTTGTTAMSNNTANSTGTTSFTNTTGTTVFNNSTATTRPSNTTGTTRPSNTTGTTMPLNTTGTTVPGSSNSTGTTVAGSGSNSTGTTTPSSVTSNPNGSNSTSTSVIDKIKSSVWKWPLIGVGVLLFAGLLFGAIALLTRAFINPVPIKSRTARTSPYSSNGPPSQQVLPPQPVHAGPSPQPLSFGTGGYTPGF